MLVSVSAPLLLEYSISTRTLLTDRMAVELYASLFSVSFNLVYGTWARLNIL